MSKNKRVKRSHNVHAALELQLAATRERGKFSTVMLAETQGIPVAGAGNLIEDEDICALAPRLVPGRRMWQGKIAIDDGPEKQVTIAPVTTEVGDLYLCGVGGDSGTTLAELLRSMKGVDRILA